MQERIRLYGGTLETGADDAGNFTVNASIPVGDTPR
jgi:signal transduction histidine kinase